MSINQIRWTKKIGETDSKANLEGTGFDFSISIAEREKKIFNWLIRWRRTMSMMNFVTSLHESIRWVNLCEITWTTASLA